MRFAAAAIGDRPMVQYSPAHATSAASHRSLDAVVDAMAVTRICGVDHLLGESVAMHRLFEQIKRVAPTRSNVLIIGENGTGKELVARCLHELSALAAGPFVAVSCSTIAPESIESELFGQDSGEGQNGAHQGNAGGQRGSFERAAGGTLLLDEITELPQDVQVKLLRALESGRMTRAGATKELDIHCRVIAATNRDPQQAVSEGKFRADLLYRISVFPIAVAPLREREEDAELLAQYFLATLNNEENTAKQFSGDSLACIRQYSWPGNVRELRNVVHRAFLLADAELDLRAVVGKSTISAPIGPEQALRIPVGTNLADAERWMIIATLKKCGGNKTRAAALLGVSLKTLYNRLNAYRAQGLEVSDFDTELMEVAV
jgi:DNA-binding NtrC family response regulator